MNGIENKNDDESEEEPEIELLPSDAESEAGNDSDGYDPGTLKPEQKKDVCDICEEHTDSHHWIVGCYGDDNLCPVIGHRGCMFPDFDDCKVMYCKGCFDVLYPSKYQNNAKNLAVFRVYPVENFSLIYFRYTADDGSNQVYIKTTDHLGSLNQRESRLWNRFNNC